MDTSSEITTYRQFWPFYVNEHSHRTNRYIHFVGTWLVLACLVNGIFNDPTTLLYMPVFGYGFAWAGHFFVEKNKPATFKHPLWSLVGDFHMFTLMCMGRMEREILKYKKI